MTTPVQDVEFDEFAEWCADHMDGEYQFAVVPVIREGEAVGPGASVLRISGRLIDCPAVLDTPDGMPGRYISFPLEGRAHVTIGEVEFQHASLHGGGRAVAYIAHDVCVFLGPIDEPEATNDE